MRCRIERKFAVFDERRGALCTPAHQRAETRREFVEVEGLDEVIVGARVESAHAIGNRVARGDHQHRHGEAALAQRGEQFETGFPGQAQVEQHQFVHRVGQREFGRAAVLDPVDAVTLLAQPVVHGGADHRVIFNEQQAHRAFPVADAGQHLRGRRRGAHGKANCRRRKFHRPAACAPASAGAQALVQR